MAYICSKCRELPGPLTQEMGGIAGTSCICGGKLEQIDDDILKAFMPFAPATEAGASGRAGHRWAWMLKMIGLGSMQKLAALPPEQRVAVIDELRRTAMGSGVRGAQYSGADFSVAEGEEFLKSCSKI